MCTTPPPQGVNGAPKVPKLCASGGINITKSIEGGSMKLTTLVDYMYMCAVTNAYLCNKCFCFFKLYYYFFFFNHFRGGI